MERNNPHCPLKRVKELAESGKVRFTATSVKDADAFGFPRAEMIGELLLLESVEFYKSMTSYHDATVWQGVYRHHSRAGMLSVK